MKNTNLVSESRAYFTSTIHVVIFNYGKTSLVCHSGISFMLISFSKMSDSQIYEADKDCFAQIHLSPVKGRNTKTQVNREAYSP